MNGLKSQNFQLTVFVLFTLLLVGCETHPASEIATFEPFIASDTATPTVTSTPQLFTYFPASTQIPDLRGYLLSEGKIVKINLNDQTSEELQISDLEITNAAISPDEQWLVFSTDSEIILKNLQTDDPSLVISPENTQWSDYIFSNNGKLLAFSDREGLKIFDLSSESTRFLVENFTTPLEEDDLSIDVNDFLINIPLIWSPDDKWLWVSVGRYEGGGYHAMIDLDSGHEYNFSYCNDSIDWLSTGEGFYTSVSASGYSVCGEDDGIFIMKTRPNGGFFDTSIYKDLKTSDPYNRASELVNLSPDETKLSFLQSNDQYSDSPTYKIVVINSDGSNQQDVVISSEWIDYLQWSADSQKIIYLQDHNAETLLKVVDLTSLEETELLSIPAVASEIEQVVNGEWLFIQVKDEEVVSRYNLVLVNPAADVVIKLHIPAFKEVLGIFEN